MEIHRIEFPLTQGLPVKLSAEARIELRKTITNHPGWDAHRKANSLSLATMTRDDYFAAAAALKIDVSALAARADASALTRPAPVTTSPAPVAQDTAMQPASAVAAAKDDFVGTVNANLQRDQFPARGAPQSVKAAQAAADFADADTVPAHDGTIPDYPTPVSDSLAAKIDNIIAVAVDADISFSALYATTRNAIAAAHALQARIDTMSADPRATKLAALTKPALDFVPPSWSRDFADYIEIGATVAVVGPAGNGKTTGARKLLERAGFNVYEFDCTDATLPQDLIGRTTLKQVDGATVTEWTAGPIAKAFADPKGAVLLNEYDALDPRTGMALQSAFEAADTRRVTAPDSGEQIRSLGACPIVLTLNTIGHGATASYQGRNALDGANRDRIEIVVTGYEAEKEIMIAHGFDAATAERLADWATSTRAELNRISSREILSNRRLLTAAALMDRCGYSLKDATIRAFYNRLPDRDRAQFPNMK